MEAANLLLSRHWHFGPADAPLRGEIIATPLSFSSSKFSFDPMIYHMYCGKLENNVQWFCIVFILRMLSIVPFHN
jgi:hypothetical protein